MKKCNAVFAGIILMAGIYSQLGWAASLKDYPALSDSTSSSQNYEIKKLLDGEIEAVLIDRANGNVIVYADDYLWKINPQGNLVDTFAYSSYDNKMFSSGIIFQKDYYIDWIFSGDKRRKEYAEHLDSNGLSEAEFIAQLNRGEELEYLVTEEAKDAEDKDETKDSKQSESVDGKENGRTAVAYLRAGNRAWTLDMSKRAERINGYCAGNDRRYQALRWEVTCLEGYDKQANRLFFYETMSKVITPVDFKRKRLGGVGMFFEELLFSPFIGTANVRSPYWYGTGYFQLKYQNETLNFSAFSERQYGEIRPKNINFHELANGQPQDENSLHRSPGMNNTGIYELPSGQVQGVGIISVTPFYQHGREGHLNGQIEKDIGLYVVRKKAVAHPGSMAVSSTSWHLDYSGMASWGPVWGKVKFLDENQPPSFYQLNNDRPRIMAGAPPLRQLVAQPLRHLPKSLSFNWAYDDEETPFRLRLEREQYIDFVSEPDKTDDSGRDRAQLVLELVFDAGEIRAAFKRLEGANQPIQLMLHMEKDGKAGGYLRISLVNDQDTVVLENTQIKPTGKAGI